MGQSDSDHDSAQTFCDTRLTKLFLLISFTISQTAGTVTVLLNTTTEST